MIGMVDWLIEKEGGKGPGYVQECTGRFCRSFSYGMTHWFQHSHSGQGWYLPLPECFEIVQQLRKLKKRCSSSDPRLASVKPLKPCRKNEERALSLMENRNTTTRDFRAKNPEHTLFPHKSHSVFLSVLGKRHIHLVSQLPQLSTLLLVYLKLSLISGLMLVDRWETSRRLKAVSIEMVPA